MKEPDYIIVGSGAEGCVLASRLTEDPGTTVLLLEAGGVDSKLIMSMPAAIPFAYQHKSLNWGEFAGPEPHLTGPDIDEKRGRVLGGSTSINAMIFNRGNPRDFDGWAAMGLTGWGWRDALACFKRMEQFSEGGNDARGGDGPLKVLRAPAAHKLFDAFMRSGEQAGYRRPAGHNSGDQEDMHIAQMLVDNGRRCSASHAYLRPARTRSNLSLRLNAHVHRVMFQGGQAVGVELVTGEKLHAAREVLIAARSVGAAKLLLLSGVGPADELRQLGIKVIADQPNVGRNLENHPGVNLQYAVRREDSLASQLGPLGRTKLGLQWLLTRRGLGASNFFEAGAFLKTHEGAGYANLQLEFLPLARRVVNGRLKVLPGFQLWMDLSRPLSGYLFIVPPTSLDMLKANYDTQLSIGCNVAWLSPDALKAKFPSMFVGDLGAAVHSPDDGWLDPHSVLLGLRKKARSLGAEFIADQVTGMQRNGASVTSAVLKSGWKVEASHFVNAAGAWAQEICTMLGFTVPITPLRRFEHYFECEETIEPTPYLKDPERLAFRPEGKGYTGGVPTLAEPPRLQFRNQPRLLRGSRLAGACPPLPAVRAHQMQEHASGPL